MSKKTAYKRRDGRWECRISMGKDENGRRVFRSFYGKSRDEAEYKAMILLLIFRLLVNFKRKK